MCVIYSKSLFFALSYYYVLNRLCPGHNGVVCVFGWVMDRSCSFVWKIMMHTSQRQMFLLHGLQSSHGGDDVATSVPPLFQRQT